MADTPATGDDNTLYEQGHHVDIRHAEETFNELSRALSRKSTHHKGDDSDSSGDLEQGEVFDLREYLTSSNDAHQSAGIKHKHVGVTWENLKVDVIGGADHKVSIIENPLNDSRIHVHGEHQIYVQTFNRRLHLVVLLR